MLKSREMKNLVQQALAAKQLTRAAAVPTEQSSVMAHWIKLSSLRRQQHDKGQEGAVMDTRDNNEDEEDEDIVEDHNGVHSGFDLDDTAKGHQLYGRTLILEESCRRALAQDCEQRSQMDLQSLGVWFQTTKLKISTDFERLQPSELDLLCRRMTCVTFHPDETVFRQGDEGDALFIVFSGTVKVRVSQRILGEVVEVTVCELSKGDYFGERSLLNNDARAATVLAKTATELVKITRNDYNLMLKNDQLEFLSRMQIANGIGVQRTAQKSQREYVKVLTKKKHARSKADIDMLSEYLQTLKFFRSLPKSFVRELCVVVDFLTLPAGACVFREGEVGDLFYIIFSGSVDVNINSKDFKGNTQMTKLINLTEGSHFGELALMKGRGVRSATVITREECQLLVICEKDYNMTLRRMQKKDMAKRVGVLDQIPMFQTPEWTGELLKELSYVLLEQKLSTGSVLYRQGDRALHVYFVVRGELVVTKQITDPFTQVKHEVFVERIGRFRVVGDEAAGGVNFNEVIHREVTVSASTPVEVLLLSKYDVFHRLSRSARETLRAAAHSHAESIVYLDRFHKTQKWENYKQKVLRDHVNHERIEKILPSQALVAANELLLLTPETRATKKVFNQEPTLGNYVTSFNAEAPPSSARQRQLDGALAAEERRQAEVLKEGNPLALFDIKVVDKQSGPSFNRPSPVTRPLSRSMKITPQALSHLLQENFIFSCPKRTRFQGHDARRSRMLQSKASSPKTPAFQILLSARSLNSVRDAAESLESDSKRTSVNYYALPLNAFALMPRAGRSKVDEERLQMQQIEEMTSAGNSGFAVTSVVLSQREVSNSPYAEPFLAVHARCTSEVEAGAYAMSLKRSNSLKCAMLCVFPIGKWLHLEHAHDWCVQVEPSKHEKRTPNVCGSPTRRLEPPRPHWQQERDEAQRLHHFICARMGAPLADNKKKDQTEESGGLLPQPLFSLEDKLDTLHNYLQASAAFTTRTGHEGVAIVKYRQVKRFGFIMRSRIAGALPQSNTNTSSHTDSPSPRQSFTKLIPG
ncbi:uncharacterized protein PITG_15140 [Phytophthora infestans T30-4]|uniref:Cyclic nucleotide-binding domain-containing protein n=1 Tax=Phytophthora infestans (strain T30-4) TaxID=403677 RepID=D0NRR6_PHYIT|nr:uncharacterized protein PITG_15140 [Phytophthora infestans T30-4]EEY63416.1 conserved hypothetical protein [Phytophthora infestans T30-4]|eukprot:XP_002898301.1 conserved hypothetical protein [Phytophthora infestans T30-4]